MVKRTLSKAESVLFYADIFKMRTLAFMLQLCYTKTKGVAP